MEVSNKFGMKFNIYEFAYVLSEAELATLIKELLFNMTGVKLELSIDNDYEYEDNLFITIFEPEDESLLEEVVKNIELINDKIFLFDGYPETTDFIMKHLFDDENITYFVEGDYTRSSDDDLKIYHHYQENTFLKTIDVSQCLGGW